MLSETLLVAAVGVLAVVVIAGGLVGARIVSRARARSRQINLQIEGLHQRLDHVDGEQDALQRSNDRLRQDLAGLAARLDDVERTALERYQAVLRDLEGLHRDLDRFDHLTQHRAALDRAATAVARAVEHGRVSEQAGARLLHHLAQVRSALAEEGQEADAAAPPTGVGAR